MTALVRIGLGVLLTLAPALCCCQSRWLTGRAVAAAPAPVQPAKPACPHCCQQEQPAPAPADQPAPAPPSDPHCVFCDGQASALPTDPPADVAAPVFAGEWLPVPGRLEATLPIHPALVAGLSSPDRTGFDARSAALFDRHVLRC